ncbi:MAG: hypothetical protein H0X66_20530 [Verrucomicrobia bacterium]|nr:hypothetical protein [Verrucomicrobiota bacterium]
MSNCGALKYFFRAFLGLLSLVFLVLGANKLDAALQFDVFAGYDSYAKEGNWFPVTFEVSHDGPGFRAIIEVSSAQFNRSQARRVPVDLPTGTLKRITIPVFASTRHGKWEARLLDEKGKEIDVRELDWQKLRHRSSGTVILGALCRTPSGLPAFPNIKVNNPEMQPVVARLQSAIFPDNPIALEGMNALYLSSERALDLKDAQIKALLAWLQSGGHLIVGVEQVGDVNGTPWLREIVPCQLTATKTVKAKGAFLNWLREDALLPKQEEDAEEIAKRSGQQKKTVSSTAPGALFKAAGTNLVADAAFESAELQVAVAQVRNGRVVASAEGTPLAVQGFHGRGRITVLTFSPERQPFSSWNNRNWLWALITEVPVKFYESSDYYHWGWSPDGVFASMIESDQLRKLPLFGLVMLLICYLVVIGPVDQLVLRRMNKQMLTWITFPCYVLFFSGLIYFIGFKLRAGDSEYSELHVVDVFPNNEKAILRGRTYASIYSPANNRYRLESEQFIAALRGEYLANWGRGEENSQAKVTYLGNRYAADIYVPVWTSQLYVNDWWQPVSAAPISISVSERGPLRVTITNNLERKLEHVRVCVDAKIYDLGTLDAESQKDFDLDKFKSIPVREFARAESAKFFNSGQWRRNTFGSEQNRVKWDLPMATSAACFISEMNNEGQNQKFVASDGLDLSRFAANGSLILLAWDGGQTLTKPLNQFTPKRGSQNSLLRMVVPRQMSDSKLSISH